MANLCLPTADENKNCCSGTGEGGSCTQDWDCLGLMTCIDDRCVGASGCSRFCERLHEGQKINCCVPESLNLHRCSADADCLGARTCEAGLCSGDSGCAAENPDGLKVVYDQECLCLGITNTCLFPDGVPCSQDCQYNRQGNVSSCLAPNKRVA